MRLRSLALALVLVAPLVRAQPVPRDVPPERADVTHLDAAHEPLRKRFEKDVGKVRLLILASPS